jgi:hypothetical protein
VQRCPLDSTQLRRQLSRPECCFVSCTAWAYKEPQHIQQTNRQHRLRPPHLNTHTHACHCTNHQGQGASLPACCSFLLLCRPPQALHSCSQSNYVYAVKVSGLQVSGQWHTGAPSVHCSSSTSMHSSSMHACMSCRSRGLVRQTSCCVEWLKVPRARAAGACSGTDLVVLGAGIMADSPIYIALS